MFADEFDDVIHWSAGLENSGYANFLEALDILIGDDAAQVSLENKGPRWAGLLPMELGGLEPPTS